MAKFFPLDLSKFKRVSSDKHTTTLRHDSGHEVKIAHSALSPKLRGNLAALPEHEAKGDKPSANRSKQQVMMADGGGIDPNKAKDFEKGATESGWQPQRWVQNVKEELSGKPTPTPAPYTPSTGMADGGEVSSDQTPQSMMIKNPNYQEGGPQPEYMPKSVADDDKPLEAPYIDPVSLGVTAATGGMSSVGPAIMNAVKNKATSSATTAIANKMFPVQSPATQVGQNSIYSKGSPTSNYNSDLVKSMPPQPKRYADGGDIDSSDVTPTDAPQAQDPNAVVADAAAQPAIPQDVAAKRQIYNDMIKVGGGRFAQAPTDQAFGPNGEPPTNFNSAAWNKATQAYGQQQSQKVEQQAEAAKQGGIDAKARAEAGLPPATPTQAESSAPLAAQPDPSTLQTQASQQPNTPSNSDPFGTQQTMDVYQQGLGQAKAGIQQQAAAEGALGRAESQQLQQQVADRQQSAQDYQDHYNQLDQERQAFQQDVQNQHIDPNHYLSSMGTAGKISTGIGLILGGMGGGLTHQENPAMKFLNAQIDRDISAQQMELGKKENLLSANMRQFGNLRDATDMTRIMQNDIVSMQLKKAAADAATPIAQARAQQAIGKLQMDSSNMIGQMAMRRTLLNSMSQGDMRDPKNMGQMLQAMRVYNPEMAKEYESRAIPGIGFAQIPIPTEERNSLISRIDLQQKLQKLEQFAKTHSGSMSPSDIGYGGALARGVQDAYRQANKQGVFKESEKDFVEKSIATDPTKFFNKYRALPAYKAVMEGNLGTLQNMASHYGFQVPNASQTAQSFKPRGSK